MHARKAIHIYKTIAARNHQSSPLVCIGRSLHRSLVNYDQETNTRSTTHFGYQTVYEDEKEAKGAVFKIVIGQYYLSSFYI